jgi:Tfp pilus assembly protein PilF
MKSLQIFGWQVVFCAILAGGLTGLGSHTLHAAEAEEIITVKAVDGTLQIFADAPPRWINTTTNQILRPGDRLRTGKNSKVTVLWSDSSAVTFEALTEIEILPPHRPGSGAGLHLIQGLFSFLHRGPPARYRVVSSGVDAGIYGTEFVMAAGPDPAANGAERTYLWVVDGRVNFGNEILRLDVTNGQAAVAGPGVAPQYVAGFVAKNLLQWAFYYPAVLDLEEVPLSVAERGLLSQSITNYEAGDLLAALAAYPAGRTPASPAERIFYAALLLSVGQISNVAPALVELSDAREGERVSRLALALRELIAAVKNEALSSASVPQLATELLGASYYEQSKAKGDASLRRALELARAATERSPKFSFAWARVADLEFSFGRTRQAMEALERSLALAPRNAQSLALKGFLLAARNNPREAIDWFNRAINVDSGLANAWLGRGLCRIRRGDLAGGREDLLIAAAIEPQRSLLRSYLAKAWENGGDWKKGMHELDLAKGLDPGDPTPWLYSALLNADHNRLNEGIRDLEKSKELNDNRQVFRARLLLDQDRAVGNANLARLYADAAMADVAVREAGRGVAADYANYSAHLFLANSYEAQRRASLSSLRFEAPAINEYLVASLLGPASGQLLAQPITQLEYSRLLEEDRLGLLANTEYFSRGAWHHSSAQYGTIGRSSYSIEAEYRSEPGERPNQDLEIRQLEAKFKQQLTPQDSVYLHVLDYRANGGDPLQHFDPGEVLTGFRFREKQSPTLLAGYHHEWSPQQHTLVLAGRVTDTLRAENPFGIVLALDRRAGETNGLAPVGVSERSSSQVEIYSADVQHIATSRRQTLVIGGRIEWTLQDEFHSVVDPSGDFYLLLSTNNPVSVQNARATTFGSSLYVYDYLTVTKDLQAVGGVALTYQEFPVNTASAPMTSDKENRKQASPKAGLVWTPAWWMELRGSYTRSLTGLGLGESVRLEPAHVAGLVQTFRGVVPTSLVGGLDGVDLETAELVWDFHWRDTFFAIGWQRLEGKRTRRLGLYLTQPVDSYDLPPERGLLRESIHFTENAFDLSVHQLVGKEWSFGAHYRLAFAELDRSYPEYDPSIVVEGLDGRHREKACLHTVELSALYRHHTGVFGRADANWFLQTRRDDGAKLPGEDFWQLNLKTGYRFPKQRAEITVGVLNATGVDYRLSPLNAYSEQPRSRTFYAQLLLNF